MDEEFYRDTDQNPDDRPERDFFFSFFALTRWDSGGYFSQSTTQPLLP
jgi:hypothetical protein